MNDINNLSVFITFDEPGQKKRFLKWVAKARETNGSGAGGIPASLAACAMIRAIVDEDPDEPKILGVDFETGQRCPSCGAPVPTIFEHVGGCPADEEQKGGDLAS